MSSYRDLIAWQRARALARGVYVATSRFPRDERFGLTQQLRRAAVSISSNIAEGSGRLTTKDWQHFLAQARGSAFEVVSQLLVAEDLQFGDPEELDRCVEEAEEVGRIINGLLHSTRTHVDRRP